MTGPITNCHVCGLLHEAHNSETLARLADRTCISVLENCERRRRELYAAGKISPTEAAERVLEQKKRQQEKEKP